MAGEKIQFVLLNKPWKKQCSMPIETDEQKKENLDPYGYRELTLEQELKDALGASGEFGLRRWCLSLKCPLPYVYIEPSII